MSLNELNINQQLSWPIDPVDGARKEFRQKTNKAYTDMLGFQSNQMYTYMRETFPNIPVPKPTKLPKQNQSKFLF